MTDDQLASGIAWLGLVLIVAAFSQCSTPESDGAPCRDYAGAGYKAVADCRADSTRAAEIGVHVGVHVLSTPVEQQTNATHPGEVVRGFKVFEAGSCTVWRFQDSVGVHYLAEGRHQVSGYDVACSVAR